jgi:hypothetical protein
MISEALKLPAVVAAGKRQTVLQMPLADCRPSTGNDLIEFMLSYIAIRLLTCDLAGEADTGSENQPCRGTGYLRYICGITFAAILDGQLGV